MLVPDLKSQLASSTCRSWLLFLGGAVPALLFAAVTRHQWEDWFITLRAAENLATGKGLVYEPGQVLQTFTSPLNVLLPAALSWLFGPGHEQGVMWAYRVVAASFLGGTVLLLDHLARQGKLSTSARWFLVIFFVIDAKILDFTINGQEAAFTVFFLGLTLVAMTEQRVILLGAAWAGVMWSRPDGFIYIGGLSLGYLLAVSLDSGRTAVGRIFAGFLKAAAVTVVLYGPWIAWSTWYYGTPISHTISAKGEFLNDLGFRGMLHAIARIPVRMVRGGILDSFFMPPYFMLGGWPRWLAFFSGGLAAIAASAWLFPRVSRLVRSASFATFLTAVYLALFSPFPYPWYFPVCAFLAIVVLAGLVHDLGRGRENNRSRRPMLAGACGVVLAIWAVVTICTAWELRVQEQVIERDGREQIGLWLKRQAAGDRQTVFLECLGYIGYFSGLKMYDYPGMSSPEVVEARAKYNDEWPRAPYVSRWAAIIADLKPDWLVLRPPEAGALMEQNAELLNAQYERAEFFDQTKQLKSYSFLPGRGYLEHDKTFIVYRRVSGGRPAPTAAANPG